MLEWSAEQGFIDLEFLPTSTNVERGVRRMEIVVQQMHTAPMALTSHEAYGLVAIWRKHRWRHGEDCRNDMTRRQEEDSIICLARSFLLEGALSKQGSNDGNPTCRADRNSSKDTLDDEIKLAGLEGA